MLQLLIPIRSTRGVMIGGFLIGAAVDLASVDEFTLPISGGVVALQEVLARSKSPSQQVTYKVAQLTPEMEASKAYTLWREFIPQSYIDPGLMQWTSHTGGSLSPVNIHPTFLDDMLSGRRYTAEQILPPEVFSDGTENLDLTGEGEDMSVYGSSNYWSTGTLMPPELVPPTTPSVTIADITDFSYIHSQVNASATWVVNHDLGRKPNVSVVGSAGVEFAKDVAVVQHIDDNTLHVTFATDQTGFARCI